MAGFSDLRLDTPRLHLRPLRPDDAPALFAMHADPIVMRYWSTPPWTAIEQAHAMVERDIAGLADGQALRLGIQRRADAALIGHCSLFKLDAACRRAEIGYALAASAWGRGLMQEALVALIDHGIDALDLNRIEADIDPRNAPSARTLERLGFAHEGLLRERWIVDGVVSDTAYYGLLRREWLARRAGLQRETTP